MYRKIYFQLFDRVIMSLKSKFETDSSQFVKSLETFPIGNTSDIDKKIGFYNDDFDDDRLVSDTHMLLSLTTRTNKTGQNLKEVRGGTQK